MLSRKQSSLGPLRLLLLIPLSLWVLNKITLKECDRQVNKPEELSENYLPPENAPPYPAYNCMKKYLGINLAKVVKDL